MTLRALPLSEIDPPLVEQLLDDAFGADRRARTAYRLRTRSVCVKPLSWALLEEDRLSGVIQCWPVRIGATPLVLVGPVAVAPDQQGTGVGTQLMQLMLEHAEKLGDPPMVMIGDPEYYERFGFTADATVGWTLPGPWEPRRLLARNIGGSPLPNSGMIEEDTDAL